MPKFDQVIPILSVSDRTRTATGSGSVQGRPRQL